VEGIGNRGVAAVSLRPGYITDSDACCRAARSRFEPDPLRVFVAENEGWPVENAPLFNRKLPTAPLRD